MIVALVGAFPEKLINQVTMGTVQLNRITANRFGIGGSLRKGGDHVVYILLGHHMAIGLARHIHARGAIARHVTFGHGTCFTHGAYMPKLRSYFSACGVYGIHHFLPACQSRFAMEIRHTGIATGALMADTGAFGNHQAHTTFGTTTVVVHHIITGDIVIGREVTGHGCHYNAVFQL